MSIFMKYGDIEGEVSDSWHAGWIDVDDITWGVRRRITSKPSTRQDRESANAEVSDLTLTRRMDQASPALFLRACCGKGESLILHLTKTGPGEGSHTYMEYVLSEALVSFYDVDAHAQSDTRPTEQITISFTGLDLKYTPYDDDNDPMASVAVGFDTTRNIKK